MLAAMAAARSSSRCPGWWTMASRALYSGPNHHWRLPVAELPKSGMDAYAEARSGNRARHAETASISDSEDAIRHNKASLSVDAAFAAEGLGSPPSFLAGMVADYVNRATRDIPASTLANMTPGSGNLGTAASTGVNVALGSLTAEQRSVLRAGGNPFNPAEMAMIGAKLGLPGYAAVGRGESGLNGGNGGRFVGLKEATLGRDAAGVQYAAALGKLSGDDFASRLGFTGDHAREFGAMFAGTSGAFRAKAESYKHVMDDPNATPEQRATAAQRMHDAAKTKKEKDTAKKFQNAVEKMKADGIDLTDREAVNTYLKNNPDAAKPVAADRHDSAKEVAGKGSIKSTTAAGVKDAVASAKNVKPSQIVQRTL
ncbi:hypothetical protein [Bradyrhizobium sp.]